MQYYDPKKPKPWPIALLNKLGVSDDKKANIIALLIGIIGIIVTVVVYSQLLRSTEVKEIPPEIIENMQNSRNR